MACLVLIPTVRAAGDVLLSPVPEWRTGPVRYIVSPDEDGTFRGLRTPEERAAFIDAFWKRRDPIPETARNEFLEEYRDRLERSESLRFYVESSRPIWEGDLGRIYLLLGAPSSERTDPPDAMGRESVTWTYLESPGPAGRPLDIVFVGDGEGDLRLSGEPELDAAASRGLDAGAPIRLAAEETPAALVRLIADHRSCPLPCAGAASRPGTISVNLRTDFYRAGDGTTYAAFTLGPGAAPGEDRGAPLAPFGGIVSLDEAAVTYPFDDDGQFAAAGPDAPGTFQTGIGIDPGRYRILFGLEDAAAGRIGYRKQDLTVPDLGVDALSLSSLTLARSIEPVEGPPGGEAKVPFVLGNLRVVPRTDATLRNGDTFHLYYQVYGAKQGADGTPRLAISYQFEGDTGADWEPIGEPIGQAGLAMEAQAWSFPIRGWPPGRFRLTVTVVDESSGHSTSRALEFRVID